MFKVRFIYCVLFLLIKYLIFFFILAFLDNRFKSIVLENANSNAELVSGLLGYIMYLLFYSSLLVVMFSCPFFLVLKIKRKNYFLFGILCFFIIEYLLYTYLFSPSDFTLGIYNLLVGFILFWLLFRIEIIQKLKND